ncbi:MATE family efflux transporter [Anaeromicropila herbilytica]|uniref:Probable multidrug resistance protein NorM n=1 Tax=Anaeromicropila herbilytica TaxID=2785025 RepID=A0A7R7EN99_9FIRM|nr:MATE family efflux transporter [Anaeromicropila herbilytica]BCN31741.1 MATE family efflux transporter [Anaeromicropila herbilytica]
MATYVKNMTTGSEIRHIAYFALPLFVGNLFQQVYNFTNSIIVGKFIDKDALAAVGATSSITFLFYSLCLGLATGAGIIASHHFGAGRIEELKKSIINSAYVTILFGIIISIISILVARDVLQLLNTPDAIIEDSTKYMRISCAGTVAVAAYNWIASELRALGDSRTPLIFLIFSCILNVILDLFFILVLHMGICGAALSTVLSQGVSAGISILYALKNNSYFRFTKEHFLFDRTMFIQSIKIGMPIAAQSAMIAVSMVALQRVVNGFGENVVAAYTATMRIEQLVQQPFQSLNSAISNFAGQNAGARKEDRIIRGYHKCVLLVAGIAFFMFAIFMIFGHNIVGLFVNDAEVIRIGTNALRVSCCFYIFLGLIHITRGLLNGVGDTNYAMINGLAEVIGRVGFSSILIHIPIVGIWAVWGTTALTWMLTAFASIIRYRKRKWKLV